MTKEEYQEKAENNLVYLINDRKENKKKFILAIIVTFLTLLASMPMIIISGLIEMSIIIRAVLNLLAFLIIILGIGVSCVLDRDAGSFECSHCKTRFKPDMKAYILGAHTLTRRYLKCPKCGKPSYCKHKFSSK